MLNLVTSPNTCAPALLFECASILFECCFFCFCHICTMFINNNRNRENITHKSCDDQEFREVVGIGASTDRYTLCDTVFALRSTGSVIFGQVLNPTILCIQN